MSKRHWRKGRPFETVWPAGMVSSFDYMYLVNHLELYIDLYLWKNRRILQVGHVLYTENENILCSLCCIYIWLIRNCSYSSIKKVKVMVLLNKVNQLITVRYELLWRNITEGFLWILGPVERPGFLLNNNNMFIIIFCPHLQFFFDTKSTSRMFRLFKQYCQSWKKGRVACKNFHWNMILTFIEFEFLNCTFEIECKTKIVYIG